MIIKFWPDSATKPGPLACGLDWIVIGIVVVLMILLTTAAARAQAWQPPYCTGANAALQFGPNGWICATITGGTLPAAPPPSQCITSNWDGTKWNCVPTNYLTTDDPPPAPPVRQSPPSIRKK